MSNDKFFKGEKTNLKCRYWIPSKSKKFYFYWQTQVWREVKGPEKAASNMQGSKVKWKKNKNKKK